MRPVRMDISTPLLQLMQYTELILSKIQKWGYQAQFLYQKSLDLAELEGIFQSCMLSWNTGEFFPAISSFPTWRSRKAPAV